MTVFLTFKDVVCPILFPEGNNEEMLKDMKNHEQRVKVFLKALDDSDLNLKTSDHSFPLDGWACCR